MAYCNKTPTSDIHLWDRAELCRDVDIECEGCSLAEGRDERFLSTAAAIAHVEAHLAAGHRVHPDVLGVLRGERAAVEAGRAWADRVVARRPMAPSYGDEWPFLDSEARDLITGDTPGIRADLAELCNCAAAERWAEHVNGTAVYVHRQIRYLNVGHWEDLTGQTREQIEHVLREWTGVPLRISIGVHPAALEADGLASQEALFESGLLAVKSLVRDGETSERWSEARKADVEKVIAALDIADKAERAPLAETIAAWAACAKTRGAYRDLAKAFEHGATAADEEKLAVLRAARDEAEARFFAVIGYTPTARGDA